MPEENGNEPCLFQQGHTSPAELYMASRTIQTWRPFSARDTRLIEARLTAPDGSRCPRCGDILEARTLTRAAAAHELECRECKRYYSRVVQTTPESMYLLRIQRLATAILRA